MTLPFHPRIPTEWPSLFRKSLSARGGCFYTPLMPVTALSMRWVLGFVLLASGALTAIAQMTNQSATAELWTELLAAQERFYEANPPSLEKKEFDAFLKEYSEKAGKLADRFKDYQAQFPASTNASDAWENWMNLLDIAANGSSVRRAELEKTEQDYLADPKLDRNRRTRIRYNQVDRLHDIAARERLVRDVKNEMNDPTDFFCRHLLNIAEFSEYPRSRELVDEVLKFAASVPTLEEYRATGHTWTNERALKNWQATEKAIREKYHGQAVELGKLLDRIGQPLQLQFTALDGTKVDLEQFRGKVVLLDFWATWCPPCVAGLPQVKSVGTKYRQEGFEVIGISYDVERDKLEKFLKKHGFAWPQFFDPGGKAAPLVQSLGQPGPPAYWLIDRQGSVADINARQDLEKKVQRLLALQPTQTKPSPSN